MSPQALLGLMAVTGVALVGLSRWRAPERRRRPDRGTTDSADGGSSSGDGWSSDRDRDGDSDSDSGGSDGGGDGGGE